MRCLHGFLLTITDKAQGPEDIHARAMEPVMFVSKKRPVLHKAMDNIRL